MTDWGTISINAMADKDNMRRLEARYLIEANDSLDRESRPNPLARLAQTFRQRRVDSPARAVNLDTQEARAV
ncbi:MAG: hypothetical protein JXQ72_00215 [Anaerolineae bacterium]|nr:hypothetical protein [Anaerolineae bacterium]